MKCESPGSPIFKMAKLSTKRFGARYGARLKKKFAEVESQQKMTYPCPYCTYVKVKRVSMGVWQCKKCEAKFSSKAYSVGKVEIKVEEEQEDKKSIQGSASQNKEEVIPKKEGTKLSTKGGKEK